MATKSTPKAHPGPPPQHEEPGEYERFEALTRGLVSVPKKEIDAERRKRQGAKKG